MYKSSQKRSAEILERRARALAERAYQKERFFNIPHGELEDLYKRTFDRHKQAGDMWAKAQDYKRAIQMYQGAIKFAPSERVEEKIREQIRGLYGRDGKRLEKTLFAVAAVLGLLGALFFISFNFTAYTIGNLTRDNLSLIGIGLFVLGLFFAFLFFRKKK